MKKKRDAWLTRCAACALTLLVCSTNVCDAQTPSRTARRAPTAATSQPEASQRSKAALASADTLEPVLPSINHASFDALLHQHVSHGLVDYAAFRNNPQFASYLASLNAVDLTQYDEPERIAFWLNVYNAYTIQLVASAGETQSIRNIDKTLGLLSLKGPWSKPFVKAAGRTLTLDDVEHRILRKEFSEPRVHFAMSFAAKGGAELRSEAYTGVRLDEQLEDQARHFLVDSPAQNRVDVKAFTVYASPILTRYRSDFGSSPSALGAFLADFYAPESAESKMLKPRVVHIRNGGGPFGARPDPAPTAAELAKRTPQQRDSAARDSTKRMTTASFFRIVETPFDWSLNIQPAKK